MKASVSIWGTKPISFKVPVAMSWLINLFSLGILRLYDCLSLLLGPRPQVELHEDYDDNMHDIV